MDLDKRTEVLEYALQIEESIKILLLLCLGINNSTKTKLFGSKAGISFQNKIDLLYDIDVLEKDEYQGLELQMNFRNKFLHDIKFNTYLSILSFFDNGIKNRFKKYLLDNGDISDEDSCREDYQNLYMSNLKVILTKIESKKKDADDTMDLLSTPTKIYNGLTDIFFNLIGDLYQQIENSNLENPDVNELVNKIRIKCKEHSTKFKNNETVKKIYTDYYSRLTNPDKMKDIFK
ncbi:hypothetical protein [Ancylomarina sp. 16SWW S1-10-2]|uniref:hypothetical protein n=1 Tax=Ancylomarina sp. 16SWW S1-10-2 TaxID=2499681 RepID=UPI0012AD3C74|nr:hypothetical protein [Ancylomarina sp. 16SWW S1-10-2]MRT92276.1 hypothetical protein [Ancylomarina sp. 16SWW S1-10-2]